MRKREKLWVVRPGDGDTVGDIVRRAREDVAAIGEGRVFVGRRRAGRADERVRPGDEIRIGEPGAAAAVEVPILFREEDLVAVAKPAGIPTVPDHHGSVHSLVAVVARAIGVAIGDLRVTSRLDRDVSGAVVFALGEVAEARLKEARARGAYARRYVALAVSPSSSDLAWGTWSTPIGTKASETRYRGVSRTAAGGIMMLAVDPLTGRTHQIRIHASGAGMPLLGDREYGGPAKLTLGSGKVIALDRIALHAARVVVPGKGGRTLVAEAPIPSELANVWTELGGEPEAWNTAVSCVTFSD